MQVIQLNDVISLVFCYTLRTILVLNLLSSISKNTGHSKINTHILCIVVEESLEKDYLVPVMSPGSLQIPEMKGVTL